MTHRYLPAFINLLRNLTVTGTLTRRERACVLCEKVMGKQAKKEISELNTLKMHQMYTDLLLVTLVPLANCLSGFFVIW